MVGDVSYRMAPPIVERYYEPTEDKYLSVILDGLHRVWLARELGLKSIWVIEIADIPETLLPVALPLQWEDVKIVEAVPPTNAKRRFRYSSPEELRMSLASLTDSPINKDNFQYFLYRDLGALGSSGIRSTQV